MDRSKIHLENGEVAAPLPARRPEHLHLFPQPQLGEVAGRLLKEGKKAVMDLVVVRQMRAWAAVDARDACVATRGAGGSTESAFICRPGRANENQARSGTKQKMAKRRCMSSLPSVVCMPMRKDG